MVAALSVVAAADSVVVAVSSLLHPAMKKIVAAKMMNIFFMIFSITVTTRYIHLLLISIPYKGT